MNAYRVEPVNGKPCHHCGSDAFEAALAHIRAHITRQWQIGPEQLHEPDGDPTDYFQATDHVLGWSFPEVFRVIPDRGVQDD